MMTQMRALRAVVLPAPDMAMQDTPTRRLLNELGHDVTRASTPDHAIELINADHTDLLVVDLTNNTLNQQIIDSLEELPESKRPEQVAIFTDAIDMKVRDYRKKFSPAKVHVFFKPLHMHGLLGVLRTMEKKHRSETAGA
jgi:DNA-binding NtrC family response regulator